MKVHSRVRTPSARLSSLISLMTRNRRKKALEIRALSSGSCGPAAPEVSLEVAPQPRKEQAGREGQCVCAGETSTADRSSSPSSCPLPDPSTRSSSGLGLWAWGGRWPLQGTKPILRRGSGDSALGPGRLHLGALPVLLGPPASSRLLLKLPLSRGLSQCVFPRARLLCPHPLTTATSPPHRAQGCPKPG